MAFVEYVNVEGDEYSVRDKDAIHKDEWLDIIYPIGSIYINVNDINPDDILGGSWVKIEGRFLLSSSNAYINGAIGGESSHKLTASESGIASHSHGFVQPTVNGGSVNIPSSGLHNHTGIRRNVFGSGSNPGFISGNSSSYDDSARLTPLRDADAYAYGAHGHTVPNHTHSVSGGSVKSVAGVAASVAHNNMPPYLVVNVWKRVS